MVSTIAKTILTFKRRMSETTISVIEEIVERHDGIMLINMNSHSVELACDTSLTNDINSIVRQIADRQRVRIDRVWFDEVSNTTYVPFISIVDSGLQGTAANKIKELF